MSKEKKKSQKKKNSSHLVEHILVSLERKHLCSTNFFPSPSSNQTLTKKIFFPIFSPKFFIHPILSPNKHILSPFESNVIPIITYLLYKIVKKIVNN